MPCPIASKSYPRPCVPSCEYQVLVSVPIDINGRDGIHRTILRLLRQLTEDKSGITLILQPYSAEQVRRQRPGALQLFRIKKIMDSSIRIIMVC